LKNTTALRDHLQEVHPDATPFECTNCHRSFKHKSSLQRHKCTKLPADLGPPIRKKPRTERRPHALFDQYAMLQTHLGSSTTFEEWAHAYQAARTPADVPLSDSTLQNIVSTWSQYFAPLSLMWDHTGLFCDQVDQWMDDQYASTLQPITTVNHLRHLRWYALYMYSLTKTNTDILEYLEDVIQSAQRHASKGTSDVHCIAMLDPYQLASLRDRIVTALQQQQRDCLDPFIERMCRASPPPKEECVTFGLTHLRCWIDLALRFVSVPLRMQCTIHLLEPDVESTNYVCKLTYRDGNYVRVVYRDKTGDTHAPSFVPIGRTISAYLTFYRRYCRPRPMAPHTFQTAHGSMWKRASQDVKEYTRTFLGIDPDKIEPTGRFVHGSRHIGLATYALAVNFDSERLRELAHLMRHSVAISEKYYSVWLDRNRNERASQNFSATMGLATTETGDIPVVDTPAYQPLTLRPPSRLIQHAMAQAFDTEISQHLHPPSVFALRDASTQTGHVDCTSTPPLTDSCTLPVCTECKAMYVVLGPLGQSRHPMFGRYFAQCLTCDGRRPNKISTMWYDLGYTPQTPSRSHRPRNQTRITNHLNGVSAQT
jgi:hypothetical protein